VIRYPSFGIAYLNTIFYTTTGTFLSVLLTAFAAYPLSRPRLFGKKFLLFLVLFPMLFNGGIVPTFLLVKSIGLYNSRWAIILPTVILSFYVLIMRTFFKQIPIEIEESATIEGASKLKVMFKLYFPLSKAGLVTIGLFYAVNVWNSYFPALIYLKDKSKFPIQLILREIVILSNITEELSATKDILQSNAVAGEAVKYAAIFITILPIMIVYVWIQKYFVKGILSGSIKG
jgi:putative aldouronate transport system permease protein